MKPRHGTVTFSWDTYYPFAPRPEHWVSRWGTQIRSVRVIWLWFAVGYYRMDDAELDDFAAARLRASPLDRAANEARRATERQ